MEKRLPQQHPKAVFTQTAAKVFILIFVLIFAGELTAQTVSFSPSKSSDCLPANIKLTDTSVGATSWLWDFGNSNTSTDQNPTVNYVEAGSYTVSLTINGNPNLKSTQIIKVYPTPKPTIPQLIQGCAPYSGVITAVANPETIAPSVINGATVGTITGGTPTTYTWNFAGALPTITQNSPVLTLTNIPAGSYNVLLEVTDDHGCFGSNFIEKAIIISPKPTCDFSIVKSNLCDLGNASFSATATVSSGSIASYAWDINNDGSIESNSKEYTHNFTAAGTYDIALTVSSDLDCTSAKTIKQVVFNTNNTVDFSFLGSCMGEAVTFADKSSLTATKWAWDFDNDGVVDNATQNPSFTYNSAGTKTAKLKVTFSDGCEKELTKSITINGGASNFTYSTATACPPVYNVGFTSTAAATLGSNIINYAWDFDNNGSTDATGATPSHDFNAAGTFAVKLTITTSTGCSFSKLSNIAITPTVVDFKTDTTKGCAPMLIKFTSIYTNLLDPIASYKWDFGDGQSSTDSVPQHNYVLPGKYDPTLTVTTSKGCTPQKIKQEMIMVGSPQKIDTIKFTQLNLCQKSPVVFVASINDKIDQLAWDFGDTTGIVVHALDSVATDTISHIYMKPGLRTIKVKAFSNGCESLVDYIVSGIQINEPVASFKASSTVECKIPTPNISFDNKSISKDSDTNWDWDFGDGSAHEISKNPVHSYTTAGDFKVMLTVNNTATGCIAKDSSMIYVTSVAPKFSADNLTPCIRDSVTFTSLISGIGNASANYKTASFAWDFGDPVSGVKNHSTDSIAKHRFTTPGLYSIKLKITEERGCTDSIAYTDYIDVRGPIVNFSNDFTEICSGTKVTFTDKSTQTATDVADTTFIKGYKWDFGDGGSSTDKNPEHVFTGSGNYNVNLEVTNSKFCVNDKTISSSVVVPAVSARYETTRLTYCADSVNVIQFTDKATGTIRRYDWDMDGDGIFELDSVAASQSRTFPTKGVFAIKQKVTTNLGCVDTTTTLINIVEGSAGIRLVNTNLGCAPAKAQLQAVDTATIVSSYLWEFGDGRSSIERNPFHDFLTPGKYTIKLTEVLTGGCTKSTTLPVEVWGAIGTFSYNSTPSCTPYTETFHADHLSGVDSLTWDFGDGISISEKVALGDSSKFISHTYTSAGSRIPVLILKDQLCGKFKSLFDLNKRINTSESPKASFTTTTVGGATCEKMILKFNDTSTLSDNRYPITSWSWDFGDGTAPSSAQHPTHTYSAPGTYTTQLTVSNNFIATGCEAVVSQSIIVNPLPIATITNPAQEFFANNSSADIHFASSLLGTTFEWSRTEPMGITTTQALHGTDLLIGGAIPATLFNNDTQNPITVTYKVIPTGPAPTYCIGDSVTAALLINPIPDVSITKSASTPTMNNDGSYSWRYTIRVTNNSNQNLDSVKVTDNLDDVFKPNNCSYKVSSINATGVLTANGLFNGSNNTATLVEGLKLAPHQTDSIIVEVKVDTHGQKDSLTVFNQAMLSCQSIKKGFTVLSDANITTSGVEPTPTKIPMIELFIPDAFSPNHDGTNEQFIITHSELMRIELEVFNRWGTSVFKSADYKNEWDGKGSGILLGQDLPSGTYYINYKMIKISTSEVVSSGVKYITLRK